MSPQPGPLIFTPLALVSESSPKPLPAVHLAPGSLD